MRLAAWVKTVSVTPDHVGPLTIYARLDGRIEGALSTTPKDGRMTPTPSTSAIMVLFPVGQGNTWLVGLT